MKRKQEGHCRQGVSSVKEMPGGILAPLRKFFARPVARLSCVTGTGLSQLPEISHVPEREPWRSNVSEDMASENKR